MNGYCNGDAAWHREQRIKDIVAQGDDAREMLIVQLSRHRAKKMVQPIVHMLESQIARDLEGCTTESLIEDANKELAPYA